MAPRDPEEAHRAATPLELFLDLAFVVAVAQVASVLHHDLVEGHAGDALIGYPLVFFAIWWAWVNLAWFGSAYDTDDALYRVATFVEMTGVLILAAGVPRAFDGRDFAVLVAGYVVIRLALVAQWLRAAAAHPEGRSTALRFALGITVVQAGWVAIQFAPDSAFMPLFLALGVCELLIPWWAEGAAPTPWHPGHIAERYSLFTIIVLGESVLSTTFGVQEALDADSTLRELAPVIVGGLLIVFSLWWVYFDLPVERVVARARPHDGHREALAFLWGYGHYFVFGGVAAVGAGLAVAVDQAGGHSELTDLEAAAAVTIPVAVYLVVVWALHVRDKPPGPFRLLGGPVSAVLVLLASFTPEPVVVTGLVLAALVALTVVLHPAEDEEADEDDSLSGLSPPGRRSVQRTTAPR
jgi:low temperature requirement protein LtrA